MPAPGALRLYCLCWSEALFAVGNAAKRHIDTAKGPGTGPGGGTAPRQPPQEAPGRALCSLPQHPCALLQNLRLQPPPALQQPFPGVSNSGFGLSPVLGEIRPLRFTTKQHFGFPPPCCSITQQLRRLQPGRSYVLGKGKTAPACKASKGIRCCNSAVDLMEQERDRPKGKAQ